MTVVEMHHNFLLKAKSLDRTDVRDILSYDAVVLLNQAQDIIIDELLANKNYSMLRPITEVEDTVAGSFDSYDAGIEGAGVVLLTGFSPSVMTFRDYIRSSSKIAHSFAPTFSATDMSNEEVPKEIIKDFETNGSNVPIFTNPKCFLEGDYLIVVPDGYSTFTSILTVYIRHPKALSLATADATNTTTCELPANIHNAIVDKAVEIYRETVNVNDLKR